jgi:Putative adhesin
MTEQPEHELVRAETFPAEGPLELDVSLTVGRIDVQLTAEDGEALVELRHTPNVAQPWAEGVSNLLNWVSDRFGDQFGGELRGTPAEAVRQARIEQTGNRLVVRAPKALPLRNIPLAVTVRAPAGSQLAVRAGSADVTVTGPCGRADVMTGAGEVQLDRADGPAIVRTGSGAIRLGPTPSGLQLRTGSGDVEASSVSGSATLATGTGDVWLGAAAGEILARSGSGDLSVADAASGSLELITGSGKIRIGVRPGVTAEVDLTSSAGKVSSELDLDTEPPEGDVPLHIRARTGSGTAAITRAPQ